jgi:hypothetical protein
MRKRKNPLFDRELKPKPVIEVEEKHVKLRVVLLVICIAVALISLGYWLFGLLSVEPGWYTISVKSSQAHCGNEFTFAYYAGADGLDAKAEREAVIRIYSKASEEAYNLFTWDVEEPEEGGVRYLSDRPNQTVTVDKPLYDALSMAKDSPLMYMGPVTAEYAKIFQYTEEHLAVRYDPAQNPEVKAFITELMGYVGSRDHIRLELLGNNQVKLCISAEFLNYAQANGVEAFLDFGWMKNAFIADYLADALTEKGYTQGYLVSYDGFGRYLEGESTEYTLSLYDRFENIVDRPAAFSIKGPVNTVSFRNYPLTEGDAWHYFSFGTTGTIASVYVDPTDGVCKSATDNLVLYSKGATCAQMVLAGAPLFLTEQLDESALLNLAVDGVNAIWAEGKEIRYTDSALILTITDGNGYTQKYMQ